MPTNLELAATVRGLEMRMEDLLKGKIPELSDLTAQVQRLEIRLGDIEKKMGEADVSLGLAKLGELKGRMDSIESKADALINAHRVSLPKEIKKEPWPIEKYPLEWRALGVEFISVNAKAEESTTFNGVTVPLIKGTPMEVPKNIAADIRRKGWA